MLKTSDFAQLVLTPVDSVRAALRHKERRQMPVSLNWFKDRGFNEEDLEQLQQIDEVGEDYKVAMLILAVFAKESFKARTGLITWAYRKGVSSEASIRVRAIAKEVVDRTEGQYPTLNWQDAANTNYFSMVVPSVFA